MNRLILFIPLLLIVLPSCDSEDAWDIFKTAGKIVTVEREVESFVKIEMLDRVNLEIYQDTVEKLYIKGPQNLLSKVSTTVKDSILYIVDNNTFNWVRDYDHKITAKVHVKHLKRIYYEGIGNISTLNQLISDSLVIRSFQSSGSINLNINLGYFHCYFNQSLVDLNVSGTANKVHAQINGTGFLYCHELITSWCRAFNQGAGDIYVYSSGFLSGVIEGSGNVYYTGNPNHTVFEYIGRGDGSFIEF